ncbi:MAG: Crp/Fnr family transcriptional regulator [Lachnospiraceae bacterium]|nr:Crp/Fnr family transcriptional regulator [Lachnospiraceae bacterium]
MGRGYLTKVLPFLSQIDADRRIQFEEYFESAPNWLLDSFSVEYIERDTVLVREGEAVDTIYMIGKGMIKATDYRIYGIPYDFMVFTKVYAYGGMEIIMNLDTYLTTLQTVTDCIVLKIPAAQYSKWLKADFNAMKHEAKLMGEYLLEQARNSRAFVFLQGVNRLEYLLINHYEKYAVDDVLCISANRQKLADYTGLCSKTITRSIQKLIADGLITKQGHDIKINRDQYMKLKGIISEILIED